MKTLIMPHNAAFMILTALTNETPFAVLGVGGFEYDVDEVKEMDFDTFLANDLDEDTDVPAYSIKQTYTACNEQVALSNLYDNQDDSWSSIATPSSILFAFDKSDVTSLKYSLKMGLGGVLGLNTVDDAKAFVNRLMAWDGKEQLMNNVTLSSLNSRFSVPLTNEDGKVAEDVIEWRFDKRIRAKIYTAKYMLPKLGDADQMYVTLFLDLVGRDLSVTSYVAIDLPLLELIQAINN